MFRQTFHTHTHTHIHTHTSSGHKESSGSEDVGWIHLGILHFDLNLEVCMTFRLMVDYLSIEFGYKWVLQLKAYGTTCHLMTVRTLAVSLNVKTAIQAFRMTLRLMLSLIKVNVAAKGSPVQMATRSHKQEDKLSSAYMTYSQLH